MRRRADMGCHLLRLLVESMEDVSFVEVVPVEMQLYPRRRPYDATDAEAVDKFYRVLRMCEHFVYGNTTDGEAAGQEPEDA